MEAYLRITPYTAKHVFRYLFASKQLLRPYGPFAITWPVFKEFALLPSGSSPDHCSFVVDHADDSDPQSFSTLFIRDVTGRRGRPGPTTWAIELRCHWYLDTPTAPDRRTISSADHADLHGFFRAVEDDPLFRSLFTQIPNDVRIIEDDWPTRLGPRGVA